MLIAPSSCQITVKMSLCALPAAPPGNGVCAAEPEATVVKQFVSRERLSMWEIKEIRCACLLFTAMGHVLCGCHVATIAISNHIIYIYIYICVTK